MKGNDSGLMNVQSQHLRGESPGRKSVTQAGFQPDISRPQIKMIPPELLDRGVSFMGLRHKTVKADSHIEYRAHAAPLLCSDSAVSFVKVRAVAGNIRTASPTV